MGLEALEEEEDEGMKNEGEESMMDGTGKHFSTNGCKNKTRIYIESGRPPHCLTGEPSITPESWLPPEYVVCGDRAPATQICLA